MENSLKKPINLYLTVGVPGSGKSTYARNVDMGEPTVYISRDELRFKYLKPGDHYFAYEDEVYNDFINLTQAAIDAATPVIIVDATFLSSGARNKFLDHLKLDGVTLGAFWMDTPLEECIRRNNLRTGRANVPENVIRRMYSQLEPLNSAKDKYYFSEIYHI